MMVSYSVIQFYKNGEGVEIFFFPFWNRKKSPKGMDALVLESMDLLNLSFQPYI